VQQGSGFKGLVRGAPQKSRLGADLGVLAGQRRQNFSRFRMRGKLGVPASQRAKLGQEIEIVGGMVELCTSCAGSSRGLRLQSRTLQKLDELCSRQALALGDKVFE